jgi:hypothetical protein
LSPPLPDVRGGGPLAGVIMIMNPGFISMAAAESLGAAEEEQV